MTSTFYQSRFEVEDLGKNRAATKKRISWVFGQHDSTEAGAAEPQTDTATTTTTEPTSEPSTTTTEAATQATTPTPESSSPDDEAAADAAAAIAARETKVSLTWSKISGKRVVYVNDEEVHSEQKSGDTFFYKFETKKGLRLHILATAASPNKSLVGPHFIKYELVINGKRFHQLPLVDGSAPTLPDSSAYPGPDSIFDILYPTGYQDRMGKSMASFNSRRKLTRYVSVRIKKQKSQKSGFLNKGSSRGNLDTSTAGTSRGATGNAAAPEEAPPAPEAPLAAAPAAVAAN